MQKVNTWTMLITQTKITLRLNFTDLQNQRLDLLTCKVSRCSLLALLARLSIPVVIFYHCFIYTINVCRYVCCKLAQKGILWWKVKNNFSSNSVSGGHHSIPRRFSWPFVPYMCTKVAYRQINPYAAKHDQSHFNPLYKPFNLLLLGTNSLFKHQDL